VNYATSWTCQMFFCLLVWNEVVALSSVGRTVWLWHRPVVSSFALLANFHNIQNLHTMFKDIHDVSCLCNIVCMWRFKSLSTTLLWEPPIAHCMYVTVYYETSVNSALAWCSQRKELRCTKHKYSETSHL